MTYGLGFAVMRVDYVKRSNIKHQGANGGKILLTTPIRGLFMIKSILSVYLIVISLQNDLVTTSGIANVTNVS